MRNVLIVAPHPDDETLGCGGTLLKHLENGDKVHWLIVTSINELDFFSRERKNSREEEIMQVATEYGFHGVEQLNFPSMSLDKYALGEIISSFSAVMSELQPDLVYSPYRLDAHSDHQIVFDAVMATTKTFRYPSVKTIRLYETLSETEYGLRPENPGFKPNTYVDISAFIDSKIEIMKIYEGEMGVHPFPRSEETLRALAKLRGSTANVAFAEAFMTIKDII